MQVWVLCDDPRADRLRPLTWLRPGSELRLGAETLCERWRRLVHPDPVFVVTRDLLAGMARDRIAWSRLSFHLEAGPLADHGEPLWISDLFVPDPGSIAALQELSSGQHASNNSHLVGWRGKPQARIASAEDLLDWEAPASGSASPVPGDFLVGLGDLIRLQDPLLRLDLARILDQDRTEARLGDGKAYAPESIRTGAGCVLDHGAVLDAREGPIVLESGTHVYPHTWIRGPFHAARNCELLGGRIGGGSSFGPECRIRGEVEATVFLGYDNKAHDGFVGHSYVGEWVNLGALTTTSDLKNNYSEVTLQIAGRRIATGQRKIGSFLGDHVKTRIGCLLDSGTTVGVGSNLFGDPAVPGKWVPSFSWGVGPAATEHALDKFLQTARIVLSRRGVSFSEALEALLRDVHRQTAPEREQRGGSARA